MEVGEVILFHLFLVPIVAVAIDLFKKIKQMNFSTPKVGCLLSLHNFEYLFPMKIKSDISLSRKC